MSFFDGFENKVMDHVTGKAALASPTNIYVGLSTTAPTDAGGNISEPSGGAYARLQLDDTDFNAAVGGLVSNNGIKPFPQASGANWGLITHFFWADDLNSTLLANLILYGALSSSQQVNDGNEVEFPDQAMTASLD